MCAVRSDTLYRFAPARCVGTPFRNIVNCRGRRKVCRTPQDQAFNHWPYYDSAPDPTDAFAYGDFCTYASTYTDPGAYDAARRRPASPLPLRT